MITTIARLFGNLLRLPLLPLWWLARWLGRPRGTWLLVRLRPRLTELERPRPFVLRWVPGLLEVMPTPLESLRRLAGHAVRDHRIRGVVVEIPSLMTGWASAAAVRDVIAKLRAGGKRVVAYLPHGGGNREIWIASAADQVLMGPEATLMALGLSIESRYLKPLLDRIGVDVLAYARGEYKTAAESLTRESMSDAQREQLRALLGTIDRELVTALASLPGMDEGRARAMFERGFLRGREAVEAGFAADVCYGDELPLRLAAAGEAPPKLIRAPRYLAFADATFFRRLWPRPYVAVVEVHGPILSQAPGLGRRGADPEHLAVALRSARADRFAVGVVLHINSPGGSALASDLIHREVLRLKEKKPVVACFGDVSASGGYYIGAAADAIVAQPVTITGSIGVVTARLVARGLFDKLGVRTEVVKTAPHADMFSAARGPTGEEEEIILRETEGFYRTFVTIVAEGRQKPYEEVEALARGRVWSGADAQARGLVDRLGGLEVAIEEALSRAQIPEAARRAVETRTVRIRRGEPPLPEPPAAAAGPGAALEAAAGLAPELLELLWIASGGERALYWAPSVPRVE